MAVLSQLVNCSRRPLYACSLKIMKTVTLAHDGKITADMADGMNLLLSKKDFEDFIFYLIR